MGMGGGGGSGQIGAHVHSNGAGQGGNLTDATLLVHQAISGDLQTVFPIGSIFLWGGTRASLTEWALECDGQAVSRTTFADLFAIIGVQFGIGDGSTTFNVPDMDEQFGRGSPNADDSGGTGGADSIRLTGGEAGVGQHTHSLGGTVILNSGSGQLSGGSSAGNTISTTSTVTGGEQNADDFHENRPAFVQAIYVIRF